jgi:hypothetical protein
MVHGTHPRGCHSPACAGEVSPSRLARHNRVERRTEDATLISGPLEDSWDRVHKVPVLAQIAQRTRLRSEVGPLRTPFRPQVTYCPRSWAGIAVRFGSPARLEPAAALRASVRRHRRAQ